jgi:hypothetical protein
MLMTHEVVSTGPQASGVHGLQAFVSALQPNSQASGLHAATQTLPRHTSPPPQPTFPAHSLQPPLMHNAAGHSCVTMQRVPLHDLSVHVAVSSVH